MEFPLVKDRITPHFQTGDRGVYAVVILYGNRIVCMGMPLLPVILAGTMLFYRKTRYSNARATIKMPAPASAIGSV
jgi:hypothetical protein